jgi:hypothetical protein
MKFLEKNWNLLIELEEKLEQLFGHVKRMDRTRIVMWALGLKERD